MHRPQTLLDHVEAVAHQGVDDVFDAHVQALRAAEKQALLPDIRSARKRLCTLREGCSTVEQVLR